MTIEPQHESSENVSYATVKVYLLVEDVVYEGTRTLGAYSTDGKAKAALQAIFAEREVTRGRYGTPYPTTIDWERGIATGNWRHEHDDETLFTIKELVLDR